MKIVIIEPSGKRGLCQYTHNLANAIAQRGHEVVLATATGFETKNLHREYKAIEVFDRFLIHPNRVLKFCFFVKKFEPDVIHIQGAIHPLAYLILWKILKRITCGRFIYTAHDVLPKIRKIYDYNVLKKIYIGMDHIIVHARQNKEQLIKYFQLKPEKISVLSVGNLLALSKGLKSDKVVCIPRDKKVILFFGIIEPHKGLMTLIRALPDIKKSIDNVFLLIAGQPFESVSPYLTEIKRLRLEDSVKSKFGYVSVEEIPGIFNVAHIVVLPYYRASQSGVVLSAFNFGKPVVATSVGGIPEIVCNGKTGFLIPPDNSRALAKAVIRLLMDDELREKMGKEALEYVQRNHSWHSIAEKTEFIYRSLLNSASQLKPKLSVSNLA